jgi:hypothetical protein
VLFISSAVIFILVNQWLKVGPNEMFEHSQLFGGTWPWAYPALCFSCGYFAYDQLDMLHYRLYSGWIPAILVHHLILLICFTLALYRNVTINYLILTLVCEVCFFIFSKVLSCLYVIVFPSFFLSSPSFLFKYFQFLVWLGMVVI